VDQQATSDDSTFGECRHQDIDPNGHVRVKGMESDAATVSVVEGCGQQMIEVYQHHRQHDHPGALPIVFEGDPRDQTRYYQMEDDVNEGAHSLPELNDCLVG